MNQPGSYLSPATRGYVAPFVVFVGAMAIELLIPIPRQWLYVIRFVLVLGVILAWSRPYLAFRPSFPVASIVLGLAVFAIWVGPDILFGYRHHWLFENSITGKAASSLAPEAKSNFAFVALRCVSSFALVPIVEELFWRGWMMRWLIDKDFFKVPLGTYAPSAFWLVAVLFASEHGPYWEVGLVAGMIYNWWIVRTRNLADCMLAHGVTNAALSAYVLYSDQWQYWM